MSLELHEASHNQVGSIMRHAVASKCAMTHVRNSLLSATLLVLALAVPDTRGGRMVGGPGRGGSRGKVAKVAREVSPPTLNEGKLIRFGWSLEFESGLAMHAGFHG
jgi:hypothetical protein